MIIKTIGLSEFRDAFLESQYCDSFSFEGVEKLFDIYDDEEEPVELDVCAMACDYDEYTEEELIEQFGDEDHEDIDSVLAELEYNTEYYALDNGNYLVRNF